MQGSNSLLLEVTGNCVRARLLELDLSDGKLEPLTENRYGADLRDSRADRVMPPLRWTWPTTERLHGSFSLPDGKTLWVLAPVGRFRPEDRYSASLLRFEPGFRTPMSVCLRFEWEGKPVTIFDNYEIGAKDVTIIPTPQGFVVASTMRPWYWVIPREAVENRMQPQRPALRAAADAEKAWRGRMLAKFDANKNGLLDPEERAVMHLDRECLEHDRADIDLDQNGFLDVDELGYFDLNHNGIIEAKEWQAIHLFHQILAEAALAKYDANHDGRLQREEWQVFAGAALWAIPVTKALKTPETRNLLDGVFEAFDTDKNGTLDKDEIAGYLDERFKALDLTAQGYKLAEDAGPGRKVSQ
jgi:hypothetical protein